MRELVEHSELTSMMKECHSRIDILCRSNRYDDVAKLTVEVNAEKLLSMIGEICGARFMRREGLWVDCSLEQEQAWNTKQLQEFEHLIP